MHIYEKKNIRVIILLQPIAPIYIQLISQQNTQKNGYLTVDKHEKSQGYF